MNTQLKLHDVFKNCKIYQELIKTFHSNNMDKEIASGFRTLEEYQNKLNFIHNRVIEYATYLNKTPCEILEALEENRTYWFMNYYQESNMPSLQNKNIYICENIEDFRNKYFEFICPSCGNKTKNPQKCDNCNWTTYGLFGAGYYLFLKDKIKVIEIFKPYKRIKK